jgi:catechol 2,3-dioxygenase-like lactoylglutathione lyase family enzyme
LQLTTIHQIAAHTRDLEESALFYRDILGAKFLAKFDPPGLLFFDFSGTRILFEKNGPKAILYFRVADIEAAHRELIDKGVAFDSPPHRIHKDENGTFGPRGAEEWMAFFKDPSGNIVALAAQR